jgi:hypothetical protein
MIESPNVVELIRNWLTGHPDAPEADLRQFMKLITEVYPTQIAELLANSILVDQNMQHSLRTPHQRFKTMGLVPL